MASAFKRDVAGLAGKSSELAMTIYLSNDIRLTATPNADASAGLTVLEAVALLAGEGHSDAPEGVCPVLSEFARVLGIAMPDFLRTELLVPLVPALVDTRDPASEGIDALHATAVERARGRALAMWAINWLAPQVLAAAGLYSDAAALAAATVPGIPMELADAHAAAMLAERPERELQVIAALSRASQAISYGHAQRAAYCVASAVVRGAQSLWQITLAEALDGHAAPVTASRAASAKARHVWADAVDACHVAAELSVKARSPWPSADEPFESQNGLEWPNGMPRFARKWAAWQRNRIVARKRGRKLRSVVGEPRPRSGQGRSDFQKEHLTWFVRIFPKVLG